MNEQQLAKLLWRLDVGETVSSTDGADYTDSASWHTGTVYAVEDVQGVIDAGLVYVSARTPDGSIKWLGLTNKGREAAKGDN